MYWNKQKQEYIHSKIFNLSQLVSKNQEKQGIKKNH